MGRGTAEPAGKTFGCCMTGIVGPLGQAVEGQADWQEGDFRIIGMTVGRAGVRDACMSSEMLAEMIRCIGKQLLGYFMIQQPKRSMF